MKNSSHTRAPSELYKIGKLKESIRKLQESVQPKNSTETFEIDKINNSISILEENVKENEILTGEVDQKLQQISNRMTKIFPSLGKLKGKTL